VRVSLSITEYPHEDIRGQLARIVRAADEGGLDTVWVADHLLQAAPGASRDDPMLEAYTTLGYLAGRSERVRLGAMVSPATYRAPALLLKAVESLNELSGGRAWLGVGAGYLEEEAQRFGLDLPPMPERFERLERLLRLADIHPILIGGTGERRTLRLVAQYADACNVFDIPDGGATIRRKLDVLKRHCEAVGRPYEEIEKTVSTRLNPGEDADAFSARCLALRELGLDHVVVIVSGPWTEEQVGVLAHTIARGDV
jgi:alkanesulfonate monooxygenase SsuD/methylene tetrahydromethanopterin reductase-like flavin-dependent oxidoreductase (luciferase family)